MPIRHFMVSNSCGVSRNLAFCLEVGDSKPFADFSGEFIGDFSVARHCLHGAICRIQPERMSDSFSLKVAAMAT